ncbi:hypothetical protein M405DRAFT_481058 [Rhizopogon salebrosus TDB-379]|nr:hypothetical protein M405DRAFT_481058 [Rhizopogon salebrosus TDB-379]
MEQNMQQSMSQQKSTSPPVIKDDHDVSDVPSSPTLSPLHDRNTRPPTHSNRKLILCL